MNLELTLPENGVHY